MSNLIERAKEFASIIHKGQKYGELPYMSHLRDVYYTLRGQFGIDEEVILSAAWLSYSLEETEITYNTLKLQFGKEIADIVQIVTTPQWKDIEKNIDQLKDNREAFIIKLAIRIISTEWVIQYEEDNKGRNYKTYEESFPYFCKTFRDNKEDDFTILYMWEYLEALYSGEILDLEEIQLRAKRKADEVTYGK